MWIYKLSIVVPVAGEVFRNRSVRTQAPDAASVRQLIAPTVRHKDVAFGIDDHVLRADEGLALPFRQKPSFSIEDLYSPISTIQHINVPASVERDAVGQVELSRRRALHPPSHEELSFGGESHDSVVAVAIANIHAAVR